MVDKKPKTDFEKAKKKVRPITPRQKPDFLKNKKVVYAIIAAIVLIVGGLAAVIFWPEENNEVVYTCDGSDNNELYARASLFTDSTLTQQLGELVETMKATEDYNGDVNCIYFSTVYSLNRSDFDEASRLLGLYETLYKANGENLSKSIKSPSTLELLKIRLDYLKEKVESLPEADQFVPSTPEELDSAL